MVNVPQPNEVWGEQAVELAKKHVYENAKAAGPECDHLFRHLPEVDKWANKLLARFPDADKIVVRIGVWMHDIGKTIGNQSVDHAINSETETLRYLREIQLPEDVISQVAHCARAHRCKDVQPESIEAKIIAAADSASHFTDIVYADMARRGDIEGALAKLERDNRDVNLLPGLQNEINPIYEAWKHLLEVYPK